MTAKKCAKKCNARAELLFLLLSLLLLLFYVPVLKLYKVAIKKFRRGFEMLSKIRHYVSQNFLSSLYHGLVHPFLSFGLISWGNTYKSFVNPIYILQKKNKKIAVRSSDDIFQL